MTILKIKNRPAGKYFNSFADDFFNQFPSILKEETAPRVKQPVPANVRENETAYMVDLIAPGLNKEDFKISLDNNIVTIAFEKKSENEQKSEKYLLSEYQSRSFSRSFNIDDQVDAENISAQYVNGILTLNFPKKLTVKESKQINVA
jgi:HSP20 family protein